VVETPHPERELASLLTRIQAAPSAFYRRRLAGSARPETVSLTTISPTRRDEMLRDQLDHLPHGTRRFADAPVPVRVGVTGSGDSLLVLAWSAADLRRERAAGVRVLGRLGVRPGMRVANALPGALATPGSLLLGDVIEDIGALDVPLGSIENDSAARQAWELVDRVQPDVLVLDCRSAEVLFAAAPPADRAWCKGIVWLRTDVGVPSTPTPPAAFAGWQRTWFAVPEATCFVASSCAAARFHVDDAAVVEVIDAATGVTVPPGRDGTVVVTPFGFDTPVLRFVSAVNGRIVTSCACGDGGAVLELS